MRKRCWTICLGVLPALLWACGEDALSRVPQVLVVEEEVPEIEDPTNPCEKETIDAVQLDVEIIRPNVLIVLDRSGSMGYEQKVPWNSAVDAVNTIVAEYQDRVRFGLSLFPNDSPQASSCAAGRINVPVAENSAPAIADALEKSKPEGSTPIADTLEQIALHADVAGLSATDRENFVLLVTDGEETCASGDSRRAVLDSLDHLREAQVGKPSIKSYVVGINFAEINGDLNCYALHGGFPREDECPNLTDDNCLHYPQTSSGRPQNACYFAAVESDVICDTLSTVIQETVPCSFVPDNPPENPNSLDVFLEADGALTPVEYDPLHEQGWDYDPQTNQLSLYGDSCDAIRSGTATVRLVTRCP